MIGQGQVTPRPEKVSAIQEISRPQTKKQLRSFLGTTNYYRKFIPNYSAIAAPLTDKLKNREPNQVGWGESEEQAFHTLKTKLNRFPILRLPDLTKKFVLRTDASDTGLGAVLLQEHGNEKFPVSYASRKLLKREKAYSVIEKECLAIIWAVQKFEPYLYGNEFDLETDHQSLVYMQRTKVANNQASNLTLASFKSLISAKLNDINKQEWHSDVEENSQCLNYRIFKQTLHFEKYFHHLNDSQAKILCKFRCVNHKLPIVSGRYNQIPRNERFCTHCNEGKIGDEFHYLFQCSRFHEQRKKYLKRYYWKNPNTLKMDQLFNCEKKTILFNLTKFCSYIMTHV